MIPLVAPTITNADRDYVSDRARNGLLEDEIEVLGFERLFARKIGVKHAVAVNSGTSALVAALWTLGIDDESPVSIPSWTCQAFRNAVDAIGAPFEFFDVHWNVKEAQAWADGPNVEVGILAHMFGRQTVANFEPLVEDWTLSLGAPLKLSADLGVCSTNRDKMISTGRGGLVFGDDDALMARVREVCHYEAHHMFGFSIGMSALQAALGNSQLRQLDEFVQKRRETAAIYTDSFRQANIDCPDHDCGSTFFRYLVATEDPAASISRLRARGIEAGRGVYPPLHRLHGVPDDDLPGTVYSVEHLLSVPVHPGLSEGDVDRIVGEVVAACGR